MTKRKPVELSLTVQKADGSGCDSYRLTTDTLGKLYELLPMLFNDARKNRLLTVRHSQQETIA